MIREWPLVGRDEELQIITQATRITGERAAGMVLAGAAGVGKTRLATEAVAACGPRDARRRWIVGTASARGVPLGAFADIATDFGPDPLCRVREVIDALIGDDRDRSVVVGVDDAHMLDDLSAFAVHQLVTRRLATVILTIRSGESQPDGITAIWKDQHLKRLELEPLSQLETTQLVERVLGGPVHSLTARRLWKYSEGNVLFLRHLVESEVAAGRIARHAGVWVWDGRPALSPALAELLDARIAQAPQSVRDVLDALAVTEPLDADILSTLTGPDAVTEAEALGLVRVDWRRQPAAVRLAHPMLGEVRCTSLRPLRRLRGRIATELARKPTTDPRDLVRRTVLTIDSDLAPDAELLNSAAGAAMLLGDVELAGTLSERAVAAGGGPEAKVTHAMALSWQERGVEAENILVELADRLSGPARVQVAIIRAINFAMFFLQPARAERELNDALPAGDDAAQEIADALRALIALVRGQAIAAVERADAILANSSASPVAHMPAFWALVGGLGDLGRIDRIEAAANGGYELADRSAAVSHLRFPIAYLQANAYRLAGHLTSSDATIARIRHATLDVPYEHSFHLALAGMSAMSRGALVAASRLLHESVAYLGTVDSGRRIKEHARPWLATVFGMAGRAADARREFAAIQRSGHDSDAHVLDFDDVVAEAWVCAAEGAVSQAISIARDAAATECRLGRSAREVCLLQAATQFGDPTNVQRLAELAHQVQGPRAPAAAAHAAALATGNADALVEASRLYEEFGDRIAAADAAAHAVVAYQKAGRQGAAQIASATARRLADECEGAQTPALRAATVPVEITARQREIISLAAQGLSNQEIAQRLSMSVRSIQGHLFRASQRVGVNSRDELIAILQGR